VKFDKYQSVQEVIDEVKSPSDVETLRAYIAETATSTDEDTAGYLAACRNALSVYEQGYYRRWSTPFLQRKLEECRELCNTRYATIYEAEIRRREGGPA
jgi:hypothetical protein